MRQAVRVRRMGARLAAGRASANRHGYACRRDRARRSARRLGPPGARADAADGRAGAAGHPGARAQSARHDAWTAPTPTSSARRAAARRCWSTRVRTTPRHLAAVEAALAARGRRCVAVLVTHHHGDHAEAALPWGGALRRPGGRRRAPAVAGPGGRVLEPGERLDAGRHDDRRRRRRPGTPRTTWPSGWSPAPCWSATTCWAGARRW